MGERERGSKQVMITMKIGIIQNVSPTYFNHHETISHHYKDAFNNKQ